MNHITECIIVGTIYFLIIRCGSVPSESSVLHIHPGKCCLFFLKPDNFPLKVCVQKYFGLLGCSTKTCFVVADADSRCYLMDLLSKEQDQHHGELSSCRPPSDHRLKPFSQWEISQYQLSLNFTCNVTFLKTLNRHHGMRYYFLLTLTFCFIISELQYSQGQF